MTFHQRYPSLCTTHKTALTVRWGLLVGSFTLCVLGGLGTLGKSPLWKVAIAGGSLAGLAATFPLQKIEQDAARELDIYQNAAWAGLTQTAALEMAPVPVPATVAALPCAESIKPLPADPLGAAIVGVLRHHKLDADWLGATQAPSFTRCKIRQIPGVKVSAVEALAEEMLTLLGTSSIPVILPQSGFISIDIPRGDRQFCNFEDYLSPTPQKFSVPIGVDMDGKLIEADLSDPNNAHLLVGGCTGSGKTEFEIALIGSIIARYSPQQAQLALVDPKRVHFIAFENSPHLYRRIAEHDEDSVKGIAKDDKEAIKLLESLVVEMEDRYKLFEQSRVTELDSFNQISPNLLPRIVCVVDEFADLMGDKKMADKLEGCIKRLGAKARAAGIHLILCTQRPEVKVVSGIIKANMPCRICLRVLTQTDAEIVLGRSAPAHHLLGKGDLLYLPGSQQYRLQSLHLKHPEKLIKQIQAAPNTATYSPPSDDPFAHSLDGLVVLESEPELPSGNSGNSHPEQSFQSYQPVAESPENAPNTHSDYLELKELRELGTGKRDIILSHWGYHPRDYAKGNERYQRAIDERGEEWIIELAREGKSLAKIVDLVWCVVRKDKHYSLLIEQVKSILVANQIELP